MKRINVPSSAPIVPVASAPQIPLPQMSPGQAMQEAGGTDKSGVYQQANDPTVSPFLRSDRTMMGQRGAEAQEQGKTPSDAHVREDAVPHPDINGGAGLHELVPTNLRDQVAKSGNPTLIGLQSGARTSTALTAFAREATDRDTAATGADEVGGHTALFDSGGTRGQAFAHDEMRAVMPQIAAATEPEEALNILLNKHLEITPNAQMIEGSEYISGRVPRLKQSGPIESPASGPTPVRTDMAEKLNGVRENVKRRGRTIKRRAERDKPALRGRLRSPSPPRDRAGKPILHPTTDDFVERDVPSFPGLPGSVEHTSEMAAYATQPQRLGFQ